MDSSYKREQMSILRQSISNDKQLAVKSRNSVLSNSSPEPKPGSKDSADEVASKRTSKKTESIKQASITNVIDL